MLKIGCHLSISKGFYQAMLDTTYVGGNTFQFFSRNPRGFGAKELDLEDLDKAIKYMKEHNFVTPLCHAPYTLNLASQKEDIRELARMILKDDFKRISYFENSLYNIHPGSHVGIGSIEGINLITSLLNEVVDDSTKPTVLLETMAGKGSEVGRDFQEIKNILDKLNHKDKFGVCLDTCHIYSAGYDIKENLDAVLTTFDEIIGLDKLKAIHLNDSKMPFNSFKDRHEVIGKGTLGLETIINIINHPKLKHLPFYLETPHDTLDGYKEEINLLKSQYN